MIYTFKFKIKQKVVVTDYDGTIWPNCVILERRLQEVDSENPSTMTSYDTNLVETYKILVLDDKLTKKSQACEFPVSMIKEVERNEQ